MIVKALCLPYSKGQGCRTTLEGASRRRDTDVAPAGVEKARVSDVDAAPFRSRCTRQAPDHRGSPELACLTPCMQRATLLTFTVHAAHFVAAVLQ
jgi:hypothetical protein